MCKQPPYRQQRNLAAITTKRSIIRKFQTIANYMCTPWENKPFAVFISAIIINIHIQYSLQSVFKIHRFNQGERGRGGWYERRAGLRMGWLGWARWVERWVSHSAVLKWARLTEPNATDDNHISRIFWLVYTFSIIKDSKMSSPDRHPPDLGPCCTWWTPF